MLVLYYNMSFMGVETMKAGEVLEMASRHDGMEEGSYGRTRLAERLDGIAGRVRFEHDTGLSGSSYEIAAARMALSAFGPITESDWLMDDYGRSYEVPHYSRQEFLMAAEGVPKVSGDYRRGLARLNIPAKVCNRIFRHLDSGAIPADVLDAVMGREQEILNVHPDGYPWHANVFDEIADGLDRAGVPCRKMWEAADKYVRGKYGRGLPSGCIVGHYPGSDALANLLQFYALATCHYIGNK